jgi:transcriptional regulator of acetoin/glycerol metabolism
LREADGGVLFLDEIGDMPLSLQTKLLRALQEREVVPLGGSRPTPVDFALICATNRDLSDLVRTGAFRPDLFFRIAQYTIELQPLRERKDRGALIDALWNALGAPDLRIALTSECRTRLVDDEWPGNFRQLVGCLRAMLALCEPGETLGVDALPAGMRTASAGVQMTRKVLGSTTGSTLDAITINTMQDALQAAGGNVSLAARRLGVSRSTLYRRMHGQI